MTSGQFRVLRRLALSSGEGDVAPETAQPLARKGLVRVIGDVRGGMVRVAITDAGRITAGAPDPHARAGRW